MFGRVLRESFRRQKRRKAIALSAVALGTAVATALANISLDIGDNVSRELRSFGANLVVLPAGGGGRIVLGGEDLTGLRAPAYLEAEEIPRVKENFWKNNILDFAPSLDASIGVARAGTTIPVTVRGTWFQRTVRLKDGRTISTGSRNLHPFWSVAGDWPREGPAPAGSRPEALVGVSLARTLGARAGSILTLGSSERSRELAVTGILTTGGDEDAMILAPLETAQDIAGLQGKLDRVEVSAMTTPESAVYERLGKTPKDLPPAEFEQWICTPFISSIAHEIGRAWPGTEVQQIRRVADSEGNILRKIGGLMVLIAVLAGVGSALTVTSALLTGVLERRAEIGLLKAMGAGDRGVISLFLAEAALIGLAGGVLGGGAGVFLSRWIHLSVFSTPGDLKPLAFAIAIVGAIGIALIGAALPARRIARMHAAEMLRG